MSPTLKSKSASVKFLCRAGDRYWAVVRMMLHTQTVVTRCMQTLCLTSCRGEFLASYLLVRSLMMFQSRGKILSFIRFLNTHKIFNKNSWRERRDFIHHLHVVSLWHHQTFVYITRYKDKNPGSWRRPSHTRWSVLVLTCSCMFVTCQTKEHLSVCLIRASKLAVPWAPLCSESSPSGVGSGYLSSGGGGTGGRTHTLPANSKAGGTACEPITRWTIRDDDSGMRRARSQTDSLRGVWNLPTWMLTWPVVSRNSQHIL